MCGILALLGLEKSAEDWRGEAIRIAKTLRHRGPDWSGTYCKQNNIICHERLAIVAPDSGDQPLYSEDGKLVLAVNAEIYNHMDYRTELEEDGFTFATGSDCEVIIPLYEKYGDRLLEESRLLGMFAFVLYDERTDSYIAARDHVGIIPLYIGYGEDGSVWFASELKALEKHCVTYECFPPGQIYSSRTGEFRKWYNPEWHDLTWQPTRSTTSAELEQQLTDSVRSHLMADVPFGVLLSGGLDSSLIASIMARNLPENSPWPRLHSFSIGLKGSPDLKYARKVASFLGTIHHEYTFTVQQGLDALSDVVYFTETYDVTSIRASTPMYLMARKIKATGVKMVLSGEGADEIFGGYLYFHKCPNGKEMQAEASRKVQQLHKYDCLRANKSMMAWGVEVRVPFLDRAFLDYSMSFNPAQKMCTGEDVIDPSGKRIEKYVLRKAFDVQTAKTQDTGEQPRKKRKLNDGSAKAEKAYLPECVLWRQKEQFSDGVGYSWIDGLKAYAGRQISDQQLKMAERRFPINTPKTKEAYLVRQLFYSHFPSDSAARSVEWQDSIACSTAKAIEWDESFKNRVDDSGRSVAGVHNAAYSDEFQVAAKH